MTPPDTSDRSWLGALFTAGGFLLALVGAAALFWHDKTILLAIAAGAGWALSIALWALINNLRSQCRSAQQRCDVRVEQLEMDLREARRQASEWSATSSSIAKAVQAMVEIKAVVPAAPARRIRSKSVQTESP